MSRSQLKYWPMFHHFDKEFMAKIKMVMVYGKYAHKALMVLKDDSVYEIGTNVGRISDSSKNENLLWKLTKVDELSDKGVQDFVWGREYGVAALTDKGEVYYWEQKESEAECAKEEARPTLIMGNFCGKSIFQISCCDSCLFALSDDGKMFMHRCDDPIAAFFERPCRKKPFLVPVTYIACSPSHVSIVDASGELHICVHDLLYTTACNRVEPSDTDHSIGHLVMSSLLQIVIDKVACGHSHILALSEKGDVYTWGENSYGQLGIGTTSTSTTAIKVASTIMGKVADIAAISIDHISAALTRTGEVFVWGRCRELNLFNPTITQFSTLHEVIGAYAHPNVMHSPLIMGDEESEEENENEEGETDVIDSLRKAFDDPSSSDLTIQVEGKLIHVNKSVLRIRSVYFRSMFKEQWTENSQSTFEHNDFPYDVYKAFLKYLYTGEIDVQDEQLMELLAVANAYYEPKLKRRCARILGEDIHVSNVARLYDIAVTHGSTELEDLCVEFASNHSSLIVLSPQFYELSAERARAFMIKAFTTKTTAMGDGGMGDSSQ